MKLYYWAAQLRLLTLWFKKGCVWAKIENNDILPLDLSYAPYCGIKNLRKITSKPIILNSIGGNSIILHLLLQKKCIAVN